MKPYALLPLLALAACATPPAEHAIENQRTIALRRDVVWTNVMEWFTGNRMQVKTVEKDSGIIYAERTYNFPLSYADCGKMSEQPIAPSVGQFNVFVKTLGARSTQVTVNADYAAVTLDPWSGQVMRVSCNSRGTLEEQILDAAGSK